MPGQQAIVLQPVPDAPALPGIDFTHSVSTNELTTRFTKTCKQYLNELRFGTGNPAATYNTVIDTRLQLIGNTNCIKLSSFYPSVISLDPLHNELLLNGYASGRVRLTNLSLWPEDIKVKMHPDQQPIVDFSWFKGEEEHAFVTASADGYVTVWDSKMLQPFESCKVSDSLAGISMHMGLYAHVAVALPGRHVFMAYPSTDAKPDFITWKDHNITIVQWHPRDMFYLFCGSTQGKGAIFDLRYPTMPVREVIPGYGRSENAPTSKVLHPLAKAKFTTDGTKLVWLDKDNMMRVFRMENGTEETAFKLECGDHNNQSRFHFDLIEEGFEYRAIVPYDNNISIVSLSANPPNRYIKHIETGFAGYVTGAKYRKGVQHIVAVSTDNQCKVFTPSTDGQPEELQEDRWIDDEEDRQSEAEDEELLEAPWSSDEEDGQSEAEDEELLEDPWSSDED
uniref:WD_REPEATS_REGION domain-containing protein n=1 Tax=Panagrellus redivivus TaxID=6233 RepID=A0A7E4ZVE9_PANRE